MRSANRDVMWYQTIGHQIKCTPYVLLEGPPVHPLLVPISPPPKRNSTDQKEKVNEQRNIDINRNNNLKL